MLKLNKKLDEAIKKNEMKGGSEVHEKRNIYGVKVKKYIEPDLFNGYRHEIRFT